MNPTLAAIIGANPGAQRRGTRGTRRGKAGVESRFKGHTDAGPGELLLFKFLMLEWLGICDDFGTAASIGMRRVPVWLMGLVNGAG